MPGGKGECTVSITESENATINLYTNCNCGATFTIDNNTQEFTLKRTDEESNEVPYFRDKVASLQGKGEYRATIEVKTQSSSSPYFFLVVALIKAEEDCVDKSL